MVLFVNGEKIDDTLIQQEAELLRPSYEQAFKDMELEERETQLLEWSKENVIEKVLIRQEAKKYGGDIPESEIQATLEEMGRQYGGKSELAKELGVEGKEEIKQSIELQMRVDRLLRDVCKDIPEPSEEAIQKFYNENKEQFKTAEQVRVSHIVKHVNWEMDERAAEQIIRKAGDELKRGTVFESLVAKYSDCPDNGGDLGYIARGQMVEEFDDVVFNLDFGQVSSIFRTRFGFHIAKVYDRKPSIVPSLYQTRTIIVEELKRQIQQESINDFVDQLKGRAKVEDV